MYMYILYMWVKRVAKWSSVYLLHVNLSFKGFYIIFVVFITYCWHFNLVLVRNSSNILWHISNISLKVQLKIAITRSFNVVIFNYVNIKYISSILIISHNKSVHKCTKKISSSFDYKVYCTYKYDII